MAPNMVYDVLKTCSCSVRVRFMGRNRLMRAAQAAGYAMVNPDDFQSSGDAVWTAHTQLDDPASPNMSHAPTTSAQSVGVRPDVDRRAAAPVARAVRTLLGTGAMVWLVCQPIDRLASIGTWRSLTIGEPLQDIIELARHP